jgi:hypothetical protein
VKSAIDGPFQSRIDYQLQVGDGSILIVQTTPEFPVGACVTLFGHADGPGQSPSISARG